MQSKLSKPLLTILFCMLLATTLLFINLDRKKMIKSEMQDKSAQLALSISETLRLSVENLQTLSNVLVFFENINHEQFKGITSQYFEADPSLLILEWQPIIAASEREAFIDKVRRSGLERFRLWEPDANGVPIAAKSRKEHVPVLHMLSRNPTGDDVNTLGLDLAWSPERMESKLQARDTGRARLSNFFVVVTGQNAQYDPMGFAITLPVYQDGIVPINSEQRRKKIIGYLAGVYSVEELTKPQTTDLLANDFNILIRDSENNENRIELSSGEASSHSTSTQIEAYGSSLHFTLTATKAFAHSRFHVYWLILPVSLLLFGITIFFFLQRLETQNHKLNKTLRDLETALKEVDTLKKREKENIYRATVHGTQHIMNNLLNQLTLVSMEIEKNTHFNPLVAASFEKMKAQALELVDKLSSVEEVEEQAIKESIRPK